MKNVSVSTDGGKTWKAIEEKAGGMGCILSFADTETGWLGFGTKFQMTTDGGATWKELALPKDVSKVAAISLRTPTGRVSGRWEWCSAHHSRWRQDMVIPIVRA